METLMFLALGKIWASNQFVFCMAQPHEELIFGIISVNPAASGLGVELSCLY